VRDLARLRSWALVYSSPPANGTPHNHRQAACIRRGGVRVPGRDRSPPLGSGGGDPEGREDGGPGPGSFGPRRDRPRRRRPPPGRGREPAAHHLHRRDRKGDALGAGRPDLEGEVCDAAGEGGCGGGVHFCQVRAPIILFICISFSSIGLTHLGIKTKHMSACQENYALDSLVLHATGFLFNCVKSYSRLTTMRNVHVI